MKSLNLGELNLVTRGEHETTVSVAMSAHPSMICQTVLSPFILAFVGRNRTLQQPKLRKCSPWLMIHNQIWSTIIT